MIRKLKIIKNSEYDLNISGSGSLNYNSDDLNPLNDFYDYLIDLKKNNKEVIFNDLTMFIPGNRGY